MKKSILTLSVLFLLSSLSSIAQDDKKQEAKQEPKKEQKKEEKKEEKPGGTRMAISEKGVPTKKKNTSSSNTSSKTPESKDQKH